MIDFINAKENIKNIIIKESQKYNNVKCDSKKWEEYSKKFYYNELNLDYEEIHHNLISLKAKSTIRLHHSFDFYEKKKFSWFIKISRKFFYLNMKPIIKEQNEFNEELIKTLECIINKIDTLERRGQ